MSASAVVHREELLGLLSSLGEALPAELADARRLLADRDAVLEEGRAQAERLRAEAEAERDRMLEQSTVVRQARADAERLLTQARAQADAMRAEVEEYVDGKLANFEVVLTRTLEAVGRGRGRLAGATDHDELRPEPIDPAGGLR